METILRYEDCSGVAAMADGADIRLFPNLVRDKVYLRARIAEPIVFRDALLALRDCIRSQLYLSPREIRNRQMDPLISVTEGPIFFEAFSADESTYARVTLQPDALDAVQERSGGCTNIEFSDQLRLGLQAMRSKHNTFLEVEREGFALRAESISAKETKIDLPQSWMQGFLEVQSALRLPAVTWNLHPADFRNLLVYLKGRKERASPRSLRFRLKSGEPPSVLVEPWDEEFHLRKSTYDGDESVEVRVWGRRRLLLLEKIIPCARQIRVILLGTGLPSFWLCDLGHISFLIGLSPWTAREWTEKEAYHLFEPPAPASAFDLDAITGYLQKHPSRTAAQLQSELYLSKEKVDSLLNSLCIQGRALYDPESMAYFHRNVFLENPPEPMVLSKREENADRILKNGKAVVGSVETRDPQTVIVSGTVKGTRGTYQTTCVMSQSGRIHSGLCQCAFFARFSLQRGPCKHILALRKSFFHHKDTKNTK